MPPPESPDDHTLRIVATSGERASTDAPSADTDQRTEDGPQTTTRHFEHPAHVQHLFSPERVEIVQSIVADPPESIRALARRLDRNPGDVNRDVHALVDYGVVELRPDDPAKRPVVPYDRVRIEVELGKSDGVTVDSSGE